MGNYSFSDLSIGMISERKYHFTEQRVEAFATLIDDKAPVHLNLEFAKSQGFKGRIVHGLFVQSVLSGMLGNEIPGPKSIINNLNLRMHNPALVGQTVNYKIEITALTQAVTAVSLSFLGMVDEKIVMSGKALCSFPNSSSI